MSTCQTPAPGAVAHRQAWPLSSSVPPLAALATAPACARALVSGTLALWRMCELDDCAGLVVSELVTNAVRASDAGGARGMLIRVCVFADAARCRLRLEVWDEAPGIPEIRDAGELAECGRGLALVDAIADRWGWLPARGCAGKCVWATLSRLSGAAGVRSGSTAHDESCAEDALRRGLHVVSAGPAQPGPRPVALAIIMHLSDRMQKRLLCGAHGLSRSGAYSLGDTCGDGDAMGSAAARPSGNLPVTVTRFVGRRQEIDEIRRLLGESRLVTLTGVGGVGKTRPAVETASRVRRAFPDGVWFADLSAVDDASPRRPARGGGAAAR